MPSSYRVALAEYNFATVGGALGLKTLPINETIPKNSIIVGSYIDVLAELTSAGAAEISIGYVSGIECGGENSLESINGIDSWTNNNPGVKTTAPAKVKFTIGAFALTGGRMRVFTVFLVSTASA
jgi:hypothetical protein